MNDSSVYAIDEALEQFLPTANAPYSMVTDAARYSLFAGGKRIRPTLLIEFHLLCGGHAKDAMPFAAALEMIHTYSLIHDDLPCMDDDDLRRGRASCHKAYGESTALLAGDALLTHAFYTAAQTVSVPPDRVLRALAVLAEKAGIGGMVQGQAMDLAFEKEIPTAEELREMYAKKTACLLQAAAMIGCILAGAEQSLVDAAEEYALKLGLAFQMIDDILDLTADQELLGKPTGSDDKNGKFTVVSLTGIEESRKEAACLTQEALNLLTRFQGDQTRLKEMTEQLLFRTY